MSRTKGTTHRDKILKVALSLLTKEGRDAVTTRSVADAANVQPPVIYRIFGDKDGLLAAVAEYGFHAYISKKRPLRPQDDPVEALRAGWDLHVRFGLENPDLYLLMYADPSSGGESPAADKALRMLTELMQRVAAAGRLRVEINRACDLYHSAAVGVVMLLLSRDSAQRDITLSGVARDNALEKLTTLPPRSAGATIPAAANQLRALLLRETRKAPVLSEGEHLLLSEWLLRLSGQKQ